MMRAAMKLRADRMLAAMLITFALFAGAAVATLVGTPGPPSALLW